MIKSMTGFGKGEANSKLGRFTVEIRTVNHKYFDVSSRIPNSLGQFEDRIKSYLHKYMKRGKINLALSHRKGSKALSATRIDEEAVAKYYKMLKKINARFGLKDNVRLSHILSFPDVIVQEQLDCDVNSMWPALEQAIRLSALDCNRMREKEGEVLYRDFLKRIIKITDSINEISKLAPRLISEYRHKLYSRIKELLKGRSYHIDRSRLETELAIFAKQSDITEELTRAKSHLEALKDTLASNKEAGRRLDFILQELQREVNTLGSKASSIKISRFIVDIKSEIEKMREQAQNVE